jgi:hypothetical protein
MDLWDLTRVMVRRWYLTAPLVLATIVATFWITTATGPDYEASGHVAVIPPEVQRVAEAGEMLRVSPWNEEALAHAAQIRLEAKHLQENLAEQGFHGEWSVQVSGRLPVVSIAVVAPTAEQAVDTLHRLQAVVDDEVRIRQEEYAVPVEEQIRTVRYDTGESVDTSASGLRRALVAALGAGAILTIAVVTAFDAVARVRQRRREQSVRTAEPRWSATVAVKAAMLPNGAYPTGNGWAPAPKPVVSDAMTAGPHAAGRISSDPTTAARKRQR